MFQLFPIVPVYHSILSQLFSELFSSCLNYICKFVEYRVDVSPVDLSSGASHFHSLSLFLSSSLPFSPSLSLSFFLSLPECAAADSADYYGASVSGHVCDRIAPTTESNLKINGAWSNLVRDSPMFKNYS
jgi:hypothetical protein